MNFANPAPPRARVLDPDAPRRGRQWAVLILLALIVFGLPRAVHTYVETLWFGELGFASVYWYSLKLRLALFFGFALATIVILRAAFWLLERTFASITLGTAVIRIDNQPVTINPGRFLKSLAWGITLVWAFLTGLLMNGRWNLFALFLHQSPTSQPDPILGKPLGFYLFTLPIQQSLASWLLGLAFIVLIGTVVYAFFATAQRLTNATRPAHDAVTAAYAAASLALAGVLLILAWQVLLTRYETLWDDHNIFTGVSYAQAKVSLPGMLLVAVTLVFAAGLAMLNAFLWRRLRLVLIALAVPTVLFIAVGLIASYVNNFIVKPNQLERESPYIEHNIEWTRRAFGLDRIAARDFPAEPSTAAFNLQANRTALDNIRLWDWHALQDTLRQVQLFRTYYDFPDVDIDRYRINGSQRQVMLAARELDVNKLPPSSRNWVNERLTYTHGYGVTMNTVNGFTTEGRPEFVLSDLPVQSSVNGIKVTRPEIYFGQRTDLPIYVMTKQKEFNYPQGDTNNYTTYEGTGGIPLSGFLRRSLLAWTLGDLSKVPFSNDITADSRVLMYRNIRERVERLAPFLLFDPDPYVVVDESGRLFWIMDAYTASPRYPYARHYEMGGHAMNYLRNSVKVTVDAYNGAVRFYIFEPNDPIIQSYRRAFPALFRDASQMPDDLRAHVRYPEMLFRTQAAVYGLYHTKNVKIFFGREDVRTVASQVRANDGQGQDAQLIDPYFVLMRLPGEKAAEEFVLILPFTQSNRNNLIGWMAGRSDGEAYGSLLVYNFPKTHQVDGPLQIEARIDQDPTLSQQFTLWNQHGSRVLRGNLLVIPLGQSLLYVEPVYLQAENSPMPELRYVVLAAQNRLAYGPTFEAALANLLGASTEPARAGQPGEKPTSARPGATAPGATQQQLIKRAAQDLAAYQRLTAEGKLGEAGQRLESLKRTLEELQRR
ncbi:MAG: UPF0182 family protein [Armatimonadota bacterium]|nr:UPF0182 family protein [Armatimonadota bacterium]